MTGSSSRVCCRGMQRSSAINIFCVILRSDLVGIFLENVGGWMVIGHDEKKMRDNADASLRGAW